MGSSMVSIADNCFWTRDGLLQIWLAMVAFELDQWEEPEEWVHELAAQWRKEALSDSLGAIDPHLDAVVTDVTQSTIEEACRRAIKRLNEHIEAGNELFSLADAGIEAAHAHRAFSCEAVRVRRVGSAFFALLRGKMKTPMTNVEGIPFIW